MKEEKHIDDSVPMTRAGISITGVNLTAEEGYVWSRVDGVMSVEQLCAVTGFNKQKILDVLYRLQDLGMIDLPQTMEQTEQEFRPYEKVNTGVGMKSGSCGTVGEHDHVKTKTGKVPADDSLNIDLSREKRDSIESFHSCLDELTFYQALGVTRDAGTKEIMRAYKKKSLQYHPDRHYGKELGHYKTLLEEIFKYLTKVKDFLLDPEKRSHYDETLYENDEMRRLADDAVRKENDALRSHEDLREAADRVVSRVRQGPKPRPADKASTATGKREGGSPAESRNGSRRTHRRKKSQLRMRALAMRLGEPVTNGGVGGGESSRKSTSSTPRKPTHPIRSTTTQNISSVIKKAVDERKSKGEKHYEEGVKKLLDSNFIGASTSLKLATVFDPDNEEYKKKYEVAAARAGEIVAQQQYKQAKFHLSVGRWEAASRLLVQAADHHPIATYEMEAAQTLLKTGELRRAQQYAIKAVESAPESVEARVILASVYKAAEMYRNAKREVEIALKLDPDNSEARGLSREIRKCI